MNAGADRAPTTSTAATSATWAIAQTRSFVNAYDPRRFAKNALRHESCTIRPGMLMPSTRSDGPSVPWKMNEAAMQRTPASTPATSAIPVAAAAPLRHSASPVALKRTVSGSGTAPGWRRA